IVDCFDDPEGVMEDAADGEYAGEDVVAGWAIWPPVPYSYNTINNVGIAPSAPDGDHLLGTD
ncbi:MAG: ABC transporter permease, partial [Rhodobacteraceae bacterium]|nr:ABC transporter permease [Paracoccaceae bacterium]